MNFKIKNTITYLTLLALVVVNITSLFAQEKSESYQFSYALKLYNEKFYDLSSQQLSQYITRFQGEKQVPDAHFYLAKCYEHLSKNDLAIIEYKKLALDYPRHPKAIFAWQQSGELYEKLENYKEAGKAYENIQILYSDTEAAPEGLLRAGKVYYKMKENVGARRVLNEIVSRYTESMFVFEAELYLAKIAIDEGNYPLGIKKLKKLITGENEAQTAPAKIELVKTYLNMNNVARAENILNEISEKNQNLEAVQQQIRLFWKKKQYTQSINVLKKKLLNADGDKHVFLEMLIDAYTLNGNYEQALALYGQIPQDKISQNLKYKQLLLLAKKNEFNAFNKSLYKFEEHLSDNVLQLIIKTGLNKMKQNKAYSTMLELTKWLRGKYIPEEFNRQFARFYLQSLYENNKSEELKRYLNQNIDRLREKAVIDEALYYRGMFALKKENHNSAWKDFSEIVSKYPYSPFVNSAEENKDRIEKFYLKEEKMELDKVISFLGVFINEKDESNLNLLLGEMCAEQVKDFEKAMQYYKKALKQNSGSNEEEIYLKMYQAAWSLSQKDPGLYKSQ
ncbi:MAG: tetratricopeptide repeat protein, partial [Calditrichia bacterium]|nr:tetratricopeptide repeat protein [Calditrichia bacterium]